MFKKMKVAITIMAAAIMAFIIIPIMKEAVHAIGVVITLIARLLCGGNSSQFQFYIIQRYNPLSTLRRIRDEAINTE